jgi:predicted transcriptional regulator
MVTAGAERTLSKSVFGNIHFAEIVLELDRHDGGKVREIAAELGLPDKTVWDVVRRLEAGGVLVVLPAVEISKLLVIDRESDLWSNLVAVAESVRAINSRSGAGTADDIR